MGFKVLKLKNDIKSKIFLKLIKNIIPSSVFGGAKINGINADGTIGFEYSDIGEANKVLVGNEIYFDGLKEKIISSDKIPNIIVNYNLVATGKDDFNKFEIYCKKKFD
jgi:hypothetical protein